MHKHRDVLYSGVCYVDSIITDDMILLRWIATFSLIYTGKINDIYIYITTLNCSFRDVVLSELPVTVVQRFNCCCSQYELRTPCHIFADSFATVSAKEL